MTATTSVVNYGRHIFCPKLRYHSIFPKLRRPQLCPKIKVATASVAIYGGHRSWSKLRPPQLLTLHYGTNRFFQNYVSHSFCRNLRRPLLLKKIPVATCAAAVNYGGHNFWPYITAEIGSDLNYGRHNFWPYIMAEMVSDLNYGCHNFCRNLRRPLPLM